MRLLTIFTFIVALIPAGARAANPPLQALSVTVCAGTGADLSPTFLGLSYEASMLLPEGGHYYFDAGDQALVNVFKTLGIKSLRVGASAVDDARIPVPSEPDIDSLFGFARAAGVKVIYSFRLKNGDPENTARLASYIASRYGDLLDSFAIGNEPECYAEFKASQYDGFYAAWKAHYDAILKVVPQARIEGPSSNKGSFALDLARDLFSQGHLSMVSTHYYIFGNGRKAEKDPAATRARFLSPENTAIYEKAYASTAGLLAARGVPYRIDEMNSCWSGGAKEASDTYASTLWALDWTHWWAAHHICGMNYHTGERVGMNSGFQAPNYASFLRLPNRGGFAMRPIAYSHLAFTQGAQGMPAPAKVEELPESNLSAYAYRQSNGGYTVTLINKSYGDEGNTASVSVKLPADAKMGKWQKLSLLQKNGDIAAADGITFGGESVDPQGKWSGNWETVPGAGGNAIVVRVPAASATILKFVPAG
jgi:hypothetical protein